MKTLVLNITIALIAIAGPLLASACAFAGGVGWRP